MPGHGHERPSKSMGGFRVYGLAGRDADIGGVGGALSRPSLAGSCFNTGFGGPGYCSVLSRLDSVMACSGMLLPGMPVQLFPALSSKPMRRNESSEVSIEVHLLYVLCMLDANLFLSCARVVVAEELRSGDEPFKRCDGTAVRGSGCKVGKVCDILSSAITMYVFLFGGNES